MKLKKYSFSLNPLLHGPAFDNYWSQMSIKHGDPTLNADYPQTNFKIVLIEPEIPNNTGNIGRTCVGALCELHLVGQLGFEISDKQLRRAGLDYWTHLKFFHHQSWEDWWAKVVDPRRVFFFSTKVDTSYFQEDFQKGDWLVFGKETKGLESWILEKYSNQCLTIPMQGPIRSLNLATAVATVTFEGIRQLRQNS